MWTAPGRPQAACSSSSPPGARRCCSTCRSGRRQWWGAPGAPSLDLSGALTTTSGIAELIDAVPGPTTTKHLGDPLGLAVLVVATVGVGGDATARAAATAVVALLVVVAATAGRMPRPRSPARTPAEPGSTGWSPTATGAGRS